MCLKNLYGQIKSVLACFFSCLVLLFFFLFFRFPLYLAKECIDENTIQKEYYLYSNSSQAIIKRELSLLDCCYLQGYSVEYKFQSEDKAKEFFDCMIKTYRVKIVYREKVMEIMSYYCISPKFRSFVMYRGEKINLHIAIKENSIKIGSPIIFGGY